MLVNNRYWKVIIVSYSFVNFCSISLSPYPMCGPANFHLVPLPARSSAACLNQGVTVNYDIFRETDENSKRRLSHAEPLPGLSRTSR